MTPITPTPDQLREIAAGLREGDLEVDVELIAGAAKAMEDLAAIKQAREAAEARADQQQRRASQQLEYIGIASRECDLCDGRGVVEFTAGERFKERMRQKAFDVIKARHHD